MLSFEQVSRPQTKVVDAMTTIKFLLYIPSNVLKWLQLDQLLVPTYEILELKMVCELVGPYSPWYQDIYDYLQSKTLPSNLSNNQWKSFIHKASRYTIINDTLYHCSFDNTLLRCLNTDKA